MMRVICAVVALMMMAGGAVMAETKQIVLAGGCFWCLEHDIAQVDGVVDAVSGYAGGTAAEMTYEKSHDFEASGGHMEVVQVTYDSDVVGLEALLQAFMGLHDYTDVGGQFCDRGGQYAPAIFVANAEERRVAEAVVASVPGAKTPVLDYAPETNARFWPAETYHQDYAEKNPARYKFYRWGCGRDARLEQLKAQN